ncbi:MAG: hypothetical protein KDA87_17990 [Planctomycetales bacterium]|nr:hypothetical protein [Planctomycetales bacterium]
MMIRWCRTAIRQNSKSEAIHMRAITMALCVICGLLSNEPLFAQRIRPIALQYDHVSSHCLVLTESGQLLAIDTESFQVVQRWQVGSRPAHLAMLNDDRLAIADRASHCVRMFVRESGGWRETEVIAVPHSPVHVARLDATTLSVTSLWARQWTKLTFDSNGTCIDQTTIDLDFAPKRQLPLADGTVLVADAFGGHLAVVDVDDAKIRKTHHLSSSHNIADMALAADGQSVLMTMLTSNHEYPTTQSNVHWGDVMSTLVRHVSLAEVHAGVPEQTADRVHFLGHPDRATGDPTGLLLTSEQRQIICFSGVNEVGISDPKGQHFVRLAVQDRPTALALNADESKLFVGNWLADSVSIIDLQRKKVIHTVALNEAAALDDQATALSQVEQGERLFYDARLSTDGWFSCHSCHTDGHSNGLLADTLGDEDHGDAKRIHSLLGAVDTPPWAWLGNQAKIEHQIRKSIHTTMNGPEPTEEQVQALTAFVKSLAPPPSLRAARQTLDANQQRHGQQVFHRFGCADCHQPDAAYTSNVTYDVGFQDASGHRQFNPPSLRGVSQRQRLFHDATAAGIDDVVRQRRHQVPDDATQQQLSDLIAFLQSL